MSAMVRKQVYITESQEVALKKAAEQTGVKESELIRQGVDLVLAGEDLQARRKAAFERAESLADRVLALGTVSVPGRGWARDDLYDT